MSNLFNEYRKRHGFGSIGFVNEGVLFFNRKGSPALICTISTHSKSKNTCSGCNPDTALLVVEYFKDFDRQFFLICRHHGHVHPEADILEYTHSVINLKSYKPFVSRDDRDQEEWLWKFFLKGNLFRKIDKKNLEEWRIFRKTNEDFISQMMWMSVYCKYLFDIFYRSLYAPFLINRSYLMLE